MCFLHFPKRVNLIRYIFSNEYPPFPRPGVAVCRYYLPPPGQQRAAAYDLYMAVYGDNITTCIFLIIFNNRGGENYKLYLTL